MNSIFFFFFEKDIELFIKKNEKKLMLRINEHLSNT